MKKLLMGFIVGLVAFGSVNASASGKRTIDTAASSVDWVGKKVTGQHNGKVAIKSGSVTFDGTTLKAASIEMDLTKITCADIKNPKWNKKFIDHLKDDDFFSVHKFPVATFVLKKASAPKGGIYKLEGDLTMKGQTHSIAFELKVASAGTKLKATGTVIVDRTLWGIRYKSGKFFPDIGDKMIYDNFELEMSLVTK